LISGHVELWLESGNSIVFNNDIYRLDLHQYKWKKLSPSGDIPSPRVYASGTVKGNHIYLYGGTIFNDNYGDIVLQNDLWSYNIPSNSWTLLSSGEGPSTRAGSVLYSKGSSLYLF